MLQYRIVLSQVVRRRFSPFRRWKWQVEWQDNNDYWSICTNKWGDPFSGKAHTRDGAIRIAKSFIDTHKWMLAKTLKEETSREVIEVD